MRATLPEQRCLPCRLYPSPVSYITLQSPSHALYWDVAIMLIQTGAIFMESSRSAWLSCQKGLCHQKSALTAWKGGAHKLHRQPMDSCF